MSTFLAIGEQIRKLIIKGNDKMGREDTDLTSSYEALLAGYDLGNTHAEEFAFRLNAKCTTNSADTFTKYAYANCTGVDIRQYRTVKVKLLESNASYARIVVNTHDVATEGTFDVSDIDILNLNVYATGSGEGAESLYVTYEITLTP